MSEASTIYIKDNAFRQTVIFCNRN